jgi:Asp-tRNA(Asn)/Glu-tRNA(Gln) amidotransferase C subunit
MSIQRRRESSPNHQEDVHAQADLVSETVCKLEEIMQMVRRLNEVPTGDRQSLMRQLDTTADRLRMLSFIDAIY